MNYTTRKMIAAAGLSVIARMSKAQVIAGIWFTVSLFVFLGTVESNLEFVCVAAANLAFATWNISKSWKQLKI